MEHTGQALITGGQGGLAQAMARSLKDVGMKVYSPLRSELDVREETSVVDYFGKLNGIDLLICAAGITDDEVLLKMSEQNWDSVLDTNLKGAFLTAKAAARVMMKEKRGHIVFISSYSAFHPPAGQANYAASKAALMGLAKSLAKELGSRNIRVNVVVPGFMETKMTEDLSESRLRVVREKHALSEFNTVEATAKFIRCLHLDMQHTSGQVFNLDSRNL